MCLCFSRNWTLLAFVGDPSHEEAYFLLATRYVPGTEGFPSCIFVVNNGLFLWSAQYHIWILECYPREIKQALMVNRWGPHLGCMKLAAFCSASCKNLASCFPHSPYTPEYVASTSQIAWISWQLATTFTFLISTQNISCWTVISI